MTYHGNFGPGKSPRSNPQVSGEEILRMWFQLGSIGKVIEVFTIQGKMNEVTGKPFSREGLTASAYRYVLNNVDEARELFIQNAQMHGQEFNEDEFKRMLVHRANQYLYSKGREKFFKEHGLTELARTLASHVRKGA